MNDKVVALMAVVFILYHNLCSIRKSFDVLKNSDEDFKKLLAEKKPILNGYFKHLKKLIDDIIDALNFEQFEKIIKSMFPNHIFLIFDINLFILNQYEIVNIIYII